MSKGGVAARAAIQIECGFGVILGSAYLDSSFPLILDVSRQASIWDQKQSDSTAIIPEYHRHTHRD